MAKILIVGGGFGGVVAEIRSRKNLNSCRGRPGPIRGLNLVLHFSP
jgi:hypothetical protein